jgi:hypothetical protein
MSECAMFSCSAETWIDEPCLTRHIPVGKTSGQLIDWPAPELRLEVPVEALGSLSFVSMLGAVSPREVWTVLSAEIDYGVRVLLPLTFFMPEWQKMRLGTLQLPTEWQLCRQPRRGKVLVKVCGTEPGQISGLFFYHFRGHARTAKVGK